MQHKYISIVAVIVALVASSVAVTQVVAKGDSRGQDRPYYERTTTVDVPQSVDFSSSQAVTASCDRGDTVAVGGYSIDPNGVSTTHIVSTGPVFEKNLPTGWKVSIQTQEPTVAVSVTAICQKGER
jgi:hypothetical protein